jgi:hypothetical protein
MYKKTEAPRKYEKKESHAKLPDQRVLKKEEPIKYADVKEQRESLQRFDKSTRYDQGILTNHKSYQQPQAIGISDIYMLNPRNLQYHSDPNLAMRNYVRMPANVTLGYNTPTTSYGGKKAA